MTLSCPPNGLTPHLSAKHFWPVYEEAEKLDCGLAVHGGCYGDLGFSSYTVFPATRALGMPVPLAIAATGMIVDGVFDAFPNLRIGFLEGGTSWIPMESLEVGAIPARICAVAVARRLKAGSLAAAARTKARATTPPPAKSTHEKQKRRSRRQTARCAA